MLNYNSNQNLLKGIRSSNTIATMLYENPWMRKEMMTFLKKFREETGKMPCEKYKTQLEILFDAIGKEETSKYYLSIYDTNKLKKG